MYFDKLIQPIRRIRKAGFLFGIVVMIFLMIGCAGSKKKAVEETPEPFIFEEPEPPRKAPEPEKKAAVETVQPEKIPLEFQTVYFDFDKSDVRSDAARELQQNARVLKEYPDVKILVEGNCDERGTVEYNLALGDRRANAVKQYLVDLGISPNRISTISYGKERPVDPRRTEAAYAKNRRADFVLR